MRVYMETFTAQLLRYKCIRRSYTSITPHYLRAFPDPKTSK